MVASKTGGRVVVLHIFKLYDYEWTTTTTDDGSLSSRRAAAAEEDGRKKELMFNVCISWNNKKY